MGKICVYSFNKEGDTYIIVHIILEYQTLTLLLFKIERTEIHFLLSPDVKRLEVPEQARASNAM